AGSAQGYAPLEMDADVEPIELQGPVVFGDGTLVMGLRHREITDRHVDLRRVGKALTGFGNLPCSLLGEPVLAQETREPNVGRDQLAPLLVHPHGLAIGFGRSFAVTDQFLGATEPVSTAVDFGCCVWS